ncbi:MAG: [protein-PII] uridylyltransferase [Proteobacteria bacterium]|nr:[protein-PII] uridylyltransferase [Pseudomonadota bacterium]
MDSQDLPSDFFDPGEFKSQLIGGDTIACCKSAIANATNYLDRQFLAGMEARTLLNLRANFMDNLLGALWDCEDWQDAQLSLVAVGGYGRGELHPKSDIDLLILLGENCKDCDHLLEKFLTHLWDIGLDIGHSVRTIEECAEKARGDISILTNLMEARVIRGPQSLMDTVREQTATDKMWPSPDFFQAKLDEQKARHSKFADTEYNLEPNVKSSPGGLRDLQIIGWIAERHFGVVSLEHLKTEEFLNPEESDILSRGQDFMWHVRYALHMITGREEDRLLFDHQRELAKLWGFEDGDKLAVEQFMQVYYRWAGALGQLNDVLIQNFDQAILHAEDEDKIEILNGRFHIRNGYIEATAENLFQTHTPALLEIFLLCATNDNITAIGAATVRQIRDNRHQIDDDFRADAGNKKTFIDILKSPFKLTRQLRSMTRYGILGKYLPEFGKIVGQMQHDLFHTYTVDAHTLELIENIRRFQIPEFKEKFPVSSRVTKRLPKIELLYMAGLYHDIGKGRGGDHSELGAVDARDFCQRHGVDAVDTELVVWLVLNHLTMSAFSQKKDISDPEVIQQFAEHVGDQVHLDYLMSLTVADINATNPTLWNAWRASLLRQLYTETTRALRRGLENPVDKQEWIDKTRAAAAEILEYRGFTEEELADLWRERGEDYFLRERTEDIAWHTEAIAGHYDKEQPLVLVRSTTDSSVANATQIFIHARSRVHLFSTICAELEQLDLSVHDARIYNANDGMSLDTFFVLDSSGKSFAEDSARIKHIAEHLTTALNDAARAPVIPQRRTPRQVKSFSIPTVTKMTLDETKNLSVLEVSTPDRPGLLARLGKIFVDFDVELQAAKIQTLGERVEDVFFLTDNAQQAITDADLCEAIQLAIRTELDEQAAA